MPPSTIVPTRDDATAPPAPSTSAGPQERGPTGTFAVGLARAVGGAIIFGLPLLMTMEMWWLGFTMDRARLALLLVVTVPLLVGLSHVSGFEDTIDLREDIVDAFVACTVGFAVGAGVLALFGLLRPGKPPGELLGMVALQAVPGSIGALFAQSQLGQQRNGQGGGERSRRDAGYGGQLFLMAAGALFLAFNVAPTEEMVFISYKMTPWHVLALAVASLVVMHAFVYAVEFSGQEVIAPGAPFWRVFLHFTIVGYAIALLISAYVLWTFGRLDDTSWGERVTATLVLGFPAAVGAAAARLIL